MTSIQGPRVSLAADVSRAKRALARVGKVFDGTKLAAAVGNSQVAWIDDNFRRQGKIKPWEKLKAATIARKGSDRILIDKNRLRGSFEVPRVTRTEVRIGPGTNVKYAAAHQFGYPKRNIPARPILPPLDVAQKDAQRLVQNMIDAAVTGGAF